ncbi:uncharacterized protein LAJ45_07807 [Morchella importuna]|uniref:uncharacterized protein n=1 Tax=Morchella importuna TaxID=1174673 RepID=UPI001E8D388C|nr:uncharacterized protein LAJ45_07807 [Morchella importuna]KAH8148043.1 hypothetical protein LAJ45_07807 [Morchella importuna]
MGLLSTPILRAFWIIVLITFSLVLLVYHKSYISDTIHHTIHRNSTIRKTAFTLRARFLMLWVGAVVMIPINFLFVTNIYLRPLLGVWKYKTYAWTKQPHGKTYYELLKALIYMVWLFPILVLLVPPFFVTSAAWKKEYKDACKGMAIMAALDSPTERAIKDIHFTNHATNSAFVMAMSPVPVAGSMDPNGAYNLSIIADSKRAGSSNPSSWMHIEYNLGHKRYRVLSNSNTIVQEGEYQLGEHFGIPKMGLQCNLSSFEASCGFDPTVSVVDAEGKVMVKTVQFTICGELQACVDERLGDMAAVPVGLLVLQRAARGPASCCSSKHWKPGTEGRESGITQEDV